VSCHALHRFVDGELTAVEADAYRAHLVGCADCQAEFPRVMGLLGLLDSAAEASDRPAARPQLAEVGVAADAPANRPQAATDVVPIRPWRRRVVLGAMLAAAAAAIVVAIATRSGRRRGAHPDTAPVVALISADNARPSVARFAYPGAADYRPYQPKRGAAADAASVPFATIAALEARGDWHGVGVAALLQGDRVQAARYLARATSSPDVEADRAALALVEGDQAALADALTALDRVLAARPDHPAAAWNRAQILARLGLARVAASELDRIAASGQPGWSAEAARTADQLRSTVAAEQAGWNADWAAGKQLVADGALPAPGHATGRPGIFRLMFYDAVRTAPTAARVRALRPLAVELDAVAGTAVLTALVERVAASDFARRAPLAARFRAVVVDEVVLDGAAQARLLDELRRAHADDLVLGALYRFDAVAANQAEYDGLANRAGDPWFAAIGAGERATTALLRHDRVAAEAILGAARRAALAAQVYYRAEVLELELARLYVSVDRLPDAAELAQAAFARARAGGESSHALAALKVLAQVALHRLQISLAVAYSLEEAATLGDCDTQHHAHLMLAQSALYASDFVRARAELGLAPTCASGRDVVAISVAISLWRHGGTDADLAHIHGELAALRATPALPATTALFADTLEGALVIERDRSSAGAALLRSAIARAEPLLEGAETRPLARRVRAWSYGLLALAAARRDDYAAAIELLAEDKRVTAPTRCVLAIGLDDERLVVAVRGDDGVVDGRLDLAWRYPNAAPADGTPIVPAELVAKLTGCAEVDVFAPAPLEGVPRLLPAALAWAYRLEPGPRATTAVAPLRVRVSGITSPGPLGLAPLAPVVAPDPGMTVVDLIGPTATPRRVLAAIPEATEIELHTHGLRDRNHSDASYLILSPDSDGDYALTAARLDGVRLRGAPLVTLAACGSARAEPYLHQADSLPAGFLRAGARAVLATPDDVPDGDATRFFAAVRARVSAGVALAIALRDERAAWLAHDPQSWTQDVFLYR